MVDDIKSKEASTKDELTITKLEFDDEKEPIKPNMATIINEEYEKEINKVDTFINSIAESFPTEEKSNSSLKKIFSWFILGILGVLTLVISTVIVLQGFKLYNFNLEEWTLRLFVTGVFLEIIALIKIMINSLFPKDDRKVYLDFVKECAIGEHKDDKKQKNSQLPTTLKGSGL